MFNKDIQHFKQCILMGGGLHVLKFKLSHRHRKISTKLKTVKSNI